MDIDREYLEDEVREGFFVPAEIKQAWAAQLEVLNDIDKVCRDYGIQYFADWGTLLGAVRHHGYVPWDDDLDICMKRQDYDRFIRLAKDILPEYYEVFDIRSDEDNDNFVTRIINGRKIHVSKEYLEKYHGFPYTAGLDVFPLDYISSNEEEDQLQCELIRIVCSVRALVLDVKNKGDEATQSEIEEANMRIKQVEELCGIEISKDKNIEQQLLILAERLFGLYSENDADYITLMYKWVYAGRYKIPKECYDREIRVPFENISIPVPCGYDEILKIKYGDYMIPYKKGGSHDYPYFDKIKDVYKNAGVSRPEFRDTYPDYINYKQQINIIRKANRIVKKNNANTKKTVVFMPFKAKYWSRMERLYKDYCENNYNVVVIPMQYYYKVSNGTYEKYVEKDNYPNYIEITKESEYNYIQNRPDEIVIQNPYDQYNVAGTVHTNYYSMNLAMHTDKLTYIPYFVTDEIDKDDERAYKIMNYYVTMPGVVYSDRVIVQSEGIRNLYIKKLIEFFGEESEAEWEDKIEAEDIGGI